MCLPLPTDHDSILTLLRQMQELGFQSRLLNERKPCVLCKPNDPCWYHFWSNPMTQPTSAAQKVDETWTVAELVSLLKCEGIVHRFDDGAIDVYWGNTFGKAILHINAAGTTEFAARARATRESEDV